MTAIQIHPSQSPTAIRVCEHGRLCLLGCICPEPGCGVDRRGLRALANGGHALTFRQRACWSNQHTEVSA